MLQKLFKSIPRDQGKSRLIRVVDWAIRIPLAAVFVSAGIAKWVGVAVTVSTFEALGFGQWFRHFTGSLEILCGLLVLIPRLSFWSGLVLTCIATGALITHNLVGGSPLLAVVLLALCVATLWLNRAQVRLGREI